VGLQSAAGGDDGFGLAIDNPARQFLGCKSPEDDGMDGSYPSTGVGGEEGFGDHGHIDDDPISFFNSVIFEQVRHFTCLFVDLAQSPLGRLVDHVRDPNQGTFVGVFGQEAVHHVVDDIDLPVVVPAGEGGVVGVKYIFGEGEPVDLFCLFLPKLFSELWGVGSFALFLIEILRH